MNKIIFATILLLAILCGTTGTTALLAQQTSSPFAKLGEDILVLVNEHRTGMGLKPLTPNNDIAGSAEGHSKNMGAKKVPFGHQGFESRTKKLAKKITSAGSFAENVAYGPNTAKEAVDLWLNSPGHKKNIEGDYNLTGIGISKGKNGQLYYTQIFVKKGS